MAYSTAQVVFQNSRKAIAVTSLLSQLQLAPLKQ